MLGIREIRAKLPHRYPFLLVDRIVEISEDGTTAVGIKSVSANEPLTKRASTFLKTCC